MKFSSIAFLLLANISLFAQLQEPTSQETNQIKDRQFHLQPNNIDSLENFLGFPVTIDQADSDLILKRRLSVLPDTIKIFGGPQIELQEQRSLVLSRLGFRIEQMNQIIYRSNYEDTIHHTFFYNPNGKLSGYEKTSTKYPSIRSQYIYNKHDELIKVKGEYLDKNINEWKMYWQDSLYIMKLFGKTIKLYYFVKDTNNINYQIKSKMYIEKEVNGIPISYIYHDYHTNSPYAFRHENVTWPFGFIGYRSYMSGNFPTRNGPFLSDNDLPYFNAIDYYKTDPHLYVIGTFYTNSAPMTNPVWDLALKIELTNDTSDIYSIDTWFPNQGWITGVKMVLDFSNGKLKKYRRYNYSSSLDSLLLRDMVEYGYDSNGFLSEQDKYRARHGSMEIFEEVRTEVLLDSDKKLVSQETETKHYSPFSSTFSYSRLEYIYNSNLINSNNGLDNFKVFPNPFKDLIVIDLPLGNFNVEVLDINGRLISSFSNNGESRIEYRTDGLKEGLYLLKISDNEGNYSSRRIVKH